MSYGTLVTIAGGAPVLPSYGNPVTIVDANGNVLTPITNVSNPFISLPGNWDAAWRAAKANSATTAKWMTVVADSVSDGSVADDFIAHSWVGVLKATLVARGLPLMGDFFIVADSLDWASSFHGTPPFVVSTVGRTWITGGLTKMPLYTAGNGTVTFTCPYACTEMDVVFYDNVAGTFTWNLDGAGAVTVVPNCTGAGYHRRLQLSNASNIAHSIVFTGQSTGNCMFIEGVACYPTAAARTKGIGYGRCAYAGAQMLDYSIPNNPVDRAKQWQGFGAATTGFGFPTQPDLMVIQMGINDLAFLSGVGGYQRGLERVIQAARRGNPGCSVLILGVSNPDTLSTDVTSTPFANAGSWGLYLSVMANVAVEYQCAFVNIHAKWGSTGVAQGFQTASEPHPTTAGQADIAAVLASIL
jgi:GDSL-like Lipase/Acylhydrolase family